MPVSFYQLLAKLCLVDLDAGAHRACDYAALDVLTLCSSGLCLDNSANESIEVLCELLNTEGCLTDGAVDNVGLVETVLDLTSLSLSYSLCNVRSNGSCLRRRHQALRSENLTELTDNAHHVGRCDNNVELEPVLGLDLLNEILSAYVVSASCLCSLSLIATSENESSNGLTGSVRKNDSTSNLLISVTGVNTETDVNLNGLIKLCFCSLANKTKVAKLTKEQVRKIAETKMPDLNAASVEAAMSMVAGTARSMGITVEE